MQQTWICIRSPHHHSRVTLYSNSSKPVFRDSFTHNSTEECNVNVSSFWGDSLISEISSSQAFDGNSNGEGQLGVATSTYVRHTIISGASCCVWLVGFFMQGKHFLYFIRDTKSNTIVPTCFRINQRSQGLRGMHLAICAQSEIE